MTEVIQMERLNGSPGKMNKALGIGSITAVRISHGDNRIEIESSEKLPPDAIEKLERMLGFTLTLSPTEK